MKLKNILVAAVCCLTALSGCQSGLVYDEVPESVYTNVNLGSGLAKVRVRELFTNKIWQGNRNDGKGQWLENWLAQTLISESFQNGIDYTNNTGSDVTIMGKVLKAGETMFVQNTLEVVDDSTAPDGQKYIIHVFSPANVMYTTPNKGHLFVASAFDGDNLHPVFVEEVETGKYRSAIVPVRQDALVVELILEDMYACRVEPVNGAPALGAPADFTQPHQYMVINTAFRPEGAPETRRLYEIQVQLLK